MRKTKKVITVKLRKERLNLLELLHELFHGLEWSLMNIPNYLFCRICGKELGVIETDIENRSNGSITVVCKKHSEV